jgi:enoyl-CoA hydratase
VHASNPDDGVEVIVSDGIALVTLDRAERRNALDGPLVDAILAAYDEIEQRPEVRAVVLTGRGAAFCAGAVLDTLIQSAEGGFDGVARVYDGFLRVLRSPLPTIAAVNGAAVGAGLNLALACDVRLASTAARFESRFPQLRLHPGGGHTWLLGRAVGRQAATMMSLFGTVLDAEAARTAGLVASVHEPQGLVPAALSLARQVAEIDRELVTRMVDSLRAAEQTPQHGDMLAIETERQRWSTTQPDFVRHTRALQERIAGGSR